MFQNVLKPDVNLYGFPLRVLHLCSNIKMSVQDFEKFWVDKHRYDFAEKQYYEFFAKDAGTTIYSPLVSEIAKARAHLQSSLEKIDEVDLNPGSKTEILARILFLENDNKILKSTISELSHLYREVTTRLKALEQKIKLPNGKETSNKDDQFESDEEIAEKAWIREQRLAEYSSKKARKSTIIAKSSLILDVKPWDDETNLEVMEKEIRKIFSDGLLWGASKLVPVAFGIQKLSISCVVEDEKISIDWLAEEIEKLNDFVQSVDVAAFNKI